MTQRGTLFLVVGPSGAGKDVLIEAACAEFSQDENWLFPERIIDRPLGRDAEHHRVVTAADFKQRQSDGEFALSWATHGHHYAIPQLMENALLQGKNVVSNVSRTVIDSARSRYRSLKVPVKVIVVTTPPDVLAQRLATRGRETKDEIDERLHRAFDHMPDGPDVTVVINDGTISQGAQRFIKALMAK